jgi:uncharacterized protein (DUF2252 family)
MKLQAAAAHLSVAEREELGAEARTRTEHALHTGWAPAADRPDPVALIEEQNKTRDPDLVPVRHGRMMVSPFTFYRGTAMVMAADLAATPNAGLNVQLCGDAHLSNFGAYASPGRQLVFDLNDFDETLPGPFEYDVKRMAASFTVAARNNRFSKAQVREATLASVRAYREAMAEFAASGTMDLWYAKLSEDDVRAGIAEVRKQRAAADAKTKKGTRRADSKVVDRAVKIAEGTIAKAHTRTSLQALAKLVEVVDGKQRIASQPPVLVPIRELDEHYAVSPDELEAAVHRQFAEFRSSLPEVRRLLIDRFKIVDVARKVVGVGSVGTRAFVVLLEGRDAGDPLFLQVKEATRSVLESHLPKSRFAQAGERVVHGQQLMQSASDIFLGWSEGLVNADRQYYWRQLRDMKGAAVVETMVPFGLNWYAGICGWTLARAHARSGDAIALATYLGTKGRFDKAIADFAERYADQNELDYQEFLAAIHDGRIEAREGI